MGTEGQRGVLLRAAELSLPVVLSAAAAVAAFYAVLALSFDWELFIGEADNVSFAYSLAHDGSIYFDWGGRELLFPIYPPGFYAAAAPLTWLAGHDPWAGRLVSLAAIAFGAIAAGAIARRIGCNRLEAAVASLALFSVPAGIFVSFAVRPDGLVLGLSAGALLGATVWEDSRRTTPLVLAGAVSVALLLTKQNFAPIVGAILVAVWVRDRRAGALFAAGVAAVTLLLAALVELLSSGAFLDNMRDLSDTGYSFAAFRSVLRSVLLPFPNPIYVVAAVEAVLCLRDWRRARAIAWAWPAALLVLASAIKVGSSDNYQLALALVSAILVAGGLARLRTTLGRPAVAAAMGALALALAPGIIDRVDGLPEAPGSFSARATANERALESIKAAGAPMFGDRADLAVKSENPPGLDPINHPLLAAESEWDPSPLAAQMRARRFATIQSSTDLINGPSNWPGELQEAVRAGYCESDRISLDEDGFFAEQGIFGFTQIWLYRPCAPSR